MCLFAVESTKGFVAGQVFKYSGFISSEGSLGDVGEEGEHVAILREMCKDKANLDDTFIKIQDALWHENNCRQTGIKCGPITIVVICPWGKHRARALARILRYVISRSHKLTVTQPIHLSSGDCGWWDCSQGCCWASGQGSTKKSALFAKAYDRYQGCRRSG